MIDEDKKTILVIKDDFGLAKLLFRCFEDDYNMLLADDGELGLLLYRERKPDLILLDLGLPSKVDGHVVCNVIRKENSDFQTKIVIITASNEQEDRDKAEANSVDGYIEYPLYVKEIKGIVNELLTGVEK